MSKKFINKCPQCAYFLLGVSFLDGFWVFWQRSLMTLDSSLKFDVTSCFSSSPELSDSSVEESFCWNKRKQYAEWSPCLLNRDATLIYAKEKIQRLPAPTYLYIYSIQNADKFEYSNWDATHPNFVTLISSSSSDTESSKIHLSYRKHYTY